MTVGAACAAYAANAALGLAVASKTIDTSAIRWVHHALYIATCTLTGVAIAAGIGESIAVRQAERMRRRRWPRRQKQHGLSIRQRRRTSAAGWMLVPALAPLAAIPSVSARTRTHPLIALIAAPFYAAAAVVAIVALTTRSGR
ncbi:hypothetical protein [Homoserinimonas hongtaonis]|uniref:hypothetical protein n=1 Tax=Homoserinimonas hongtaonis TaxID=2079791 RepID=UPI001E526F7A|nr:hypothetical protein [Salinibacterium hongtaonis]